jgi:hypothetical protein
MHENESTNRRIDYRVVCSSWVQAQAAGCLKGAAAGAVAGHFVGKGHAVAGAVGGCIVGRHYANQAKADAAERAQAQKAAAQQS